MHNSLHKTKHKNLKNDTGIALEASYRLILWLVPTLEKFPRSQKFLLGDRIQGKALQVLDHLVKATYQPNHRYLQLQEANLALEQMRFSVRLAFDLKLLDMAKYEHASELIDQVGRLVGGWLKSAANDKQPTIVAKQEDSHASNHF